MKANEILFKAHEVYKAVRGLYYEGKSEYSDSQGNRVWWGEHGFLHEKDNPVGFLFGLTEYDAFLAGYLTGFEFFRTGLGFKILYKKVVSRFSKRLKEFYEAGEIARKKSISAAFDKINYPERLDISKFD
jgi:hypothetical protein